MNPDGIFSTNNTAEIDIKGATLQGRIKCEYGDIVHAIGEPIETDTDYIWKVRFNDGTVASLTGPKDTMYWDINGFDTLAFTRASAAIQRSLKDQQ